MLTPALELVANQGISLVKLCPEQCNVKLDKANDNSIGFDTNDTNTRKLSDCVKAQPLNVLTFEI